MIRNICKRLRPHAGGLRSLVSLIGIIAIGAVITLGLAGYPTGEKDDGGGYTPSVPSGTIKLADTGNNTFTLTLTGGLTWKADVATSLISGYGQPSIPSFLELDGAVTAAGADSEYPNPAISYPGSISYAAERTSDTVVTVTMSQIHLSENNGTNVWYWGSGKLKLMQMSEIPANSSEEAGILFPRTFINGTENYGSFIGDASEPLGKGKFTNDSGSASASFNIPKHTGE